MFDMVGARGGKDDGATEADDIVAFESHGC